VGIYLFGFLFFFMFLGMPIVFAMAMGVLATIVVWNQIPLTMIFQQIYQGIDSFAIIAVPMFMLAGELMSKVGILDDILLLCNVIVGKFRGSLANANIVASMFFAGISGSAVSDTAAVGGALIPAMVKQGYDKDFSVAVTASSSVIGPIIPPSIGMILYGSIIPVSVSAMFAGGLIPGIMLGGALIIVATVLSFKRKYPINKEKYSPKEVIKAIVRAVPGLLMPIIILGGILGGIFTPTEAAAVAIVYALILGIFYYRTLNIKIIIECFESSMAMAGSVLMIAALACPIGWLVAMGQVPMHLSNFITSVTKSPYVVLFFINLFLLILGFFMDANVSLLVFAPILAPVAAAVGIDPVHFAVVFILNITIGLATPPFGLCLFVGAGIAKINLESAMKAILPFVLVEIAVLLLVTYIPQISLTLPKLMGLIF